MPASKYILVLNEDLARAMQELADWEQSRELAMAAELVRLALEKAQPLHESRRLLATLTEREAEIVALLLKGYTRRDIGEQLTIAPETVKTHLRNIRLKFGLKTIREIKEFLGTLPPELHRTLQ